MTPETARILAPHFVGRDPESFFAKTAAYLNDRNPAHKVSTADVIAWFNRQDAAWLKNFALHGIGWIKPDANGNYRTNLTHRFYSNFNIMQSLADMDRDAAALGHPMPNSLWTQEAAARVMTVQDVKLF